jgi:hypothetical protein
MANVNLSAKERRMMMDTDFILTKQAIIKKVYALFGDIAESYREHITKWQSQLPQEVVLISPKISKGEQYKELPYVILDYPRYFKGDDAFAVRTFFWWGNFFSITLQLGGKYKAEYFQKLLNHQDFLAEKGWYVGINEDPWHHHFEEDNYLPLGIANLKTVSGEQSVVKIANKIPLQEWDHINSLLFQNFTVLFSLLLSEH